MKTSQTMAHRFFAPPSVFAPAAVLMVVLGLSTAPTRANPQLVFTEYSSTLMTATLDGVPTGTVTNVGPDAWEWRSGTFGRSMTMLPPNPGDVLSIYWERPGGGANLFERTFFRTDPEPVAPEIGTQLSSVAGPPSGIPPHANGAFGFTWSAFTLWNTQDTPIFGPVDVHILDLRNSPVSVSDSSATLGLVTGALLIVATFRAIGRRRDFHA